MIELFLIITIALILVARVWSDRWNIAKDQSVIHIKPRTEYVDQKALSDMKLEEEHI